MSNRIQPATVVVHDTPAGRALWRVLRTLCEPSLVTINTWQHKPNLTAIGEAASPEASPIVLLDVALNASSTEAAGLFRLRLGTAVRGALQALYAARPLSDADLRQALIEFFSAREEIRCHFHDRSNDLTSGRAASNPDRFRNDLLKFQDYLHRFGFSGEAAVLENMMALLASPAHLDVDGIEKLRGGLAKIQTRIFGEEPELAVMESVPEAPPDGYGTILVADDDDYPDECVAYFDARGYHIDSVCSVDEATELLQDDPSAVFLCDMTWHGDGLAGRRLMALARQQKGCLVVALSGSHLEPGEVPEAHAICTGPEAKTEKGACIVHELIWEWANKQRRMA